MATDRTNCVHLLAHDVTVEAILVQKQYTKAKLDERVVPTIQSGGTFFTAKQMSGDNSSRTWKPPADDARRQSLIALNAAMMAKLGDQHNQTPTNSGSDLPPHLQSSFAPARTATLERVDEHSSSDPSP
jgi:hypothetical protein